MSLIFLTIIIIVFTVDYCIPLETAREKVKIEKCHILSFKFWNKSLGEKYHFNSYFRALIFLELCYICS